MSETKKSTCSKCGGQTKRLGYKYCSNSCQLAYQYIVCINQWKEGKISGLSNLGLVSVRIKRYFRQKYENKCMLCGWSEKNVKTGQVPLVADHIDGNWRNNREENLRLVCPNCDAISSTYAALNKGNGRKNRVVSNRVKEAQKLSRK